MKSKTIRFRASSVGALMIGGNEVTEKQLQEISALTLRKEQSKARTLGPDGKVVKPLTLNMQVRLEELTAKRDAPFELSATAKSLVKNEWLRREFGYKKIVVTPQMLKGNLCEQDAIRLVSSQIKSDEFRAKNRRSFRDNYFTGTPDIILSEDGFIEDVKCSWDLVTFLDVKTPPEAYKAQGQVYMHLTGFKRFRLCYCLVDTPDVLIAQEQGKYYWKYGSDEGNIDIKEAIDQVKKNHIFSQIDENLRLKVFTDEYSTEYMEKLKFRVCAARDYYGTLRLNKWEKQINSL